MGFDAGTVVKPLEWTFVKITGDEADQGTIKEPTDKAINAHFKETARIMRELLAAVQLQDQKDVSQQQLLVALADLPEDTDLGLDKMDDMITRAYSKLCSGSPSVAQLNKLPRRIRLHFYAWLMGELRPNSFGADTQIQPSNLRIVRGA